MSLIALLQNPNISVDQKIAIYKEVAPMVQSLIMEEEKKDLEVDEVAPVEPVESEVVVVAPEPAKPVVKKPIYSGNSATGGISPVQP